MKIAICTPVHGDTRAGYTFSLAKMIIHTMRERRDLDLTTITESGPFIPYLRQRLVERALQWDADYVLWIDSDHEFPVDSLLYLLDRNEPFIGVNQSKRDPDAWPNAGFGTNTPVWTTPGKIKNRVIEEVDWMGLNFVLVDTTAIRAAEEPLFYSDIREGEDVTFCRRLSQAGFRPKVDHLLSSRVGHIGLKTYTTQDSIQQRNERDIKGKLQQGSTSRIG